MAQVELLQRLADEPGLRLRELARRHRLAANTVSTLVQQLVTSGLVSREPDPDDRRAVVLRLTAEGERRLQEWLRAHEDRLTSALESLPVSDRRKVGAAVPALRRLVEALEHDQATQDAG
jgi:DNA-binding MarR family transcriptional regulator